MKLPIQSELEGLLAASDDSIAASTFFKSSTKDTYHNYTDKQLVSKKSPKTSQLQGISTQYPALCISD